MKEKKELGKRGKKEQQSKNKSTDYFFNSIDYYYSLKQINKLPESTKHKTVQDSQDASSNQLNVDKNINIKDKQQKQKVKDTIWPLNTFNNDWTTKLKILNKKEKNKEIKKNVKRHTVLKLFIKDYEFLKNYSQILGKKSKEQVASEYTNR